MKLLKHFIFAYRDVGVRPLLLSLLAFVCLVSMAVSKGEFLQRVYINRAAIGLIHEIRSLPSYAQSCRRQNDQDAQQLVGAPIISANLPIALAYWSKGKCLLAEVELRSLVERAPAHLVGWYWLGVVEARADAPASAMAFQKAGAAFNVVYFAEQAYESQDLLRASLWLRIAAQMSAVSPLDIYRTAWKYYELGDREAAIGFLKPYYAALPAGSIDSLRTAGMLERVQGHIAEAIRYYEMGLQKAPTDLDLLYRLKSTYLDIGDYDKALEVALIEAKYTPDVSQRQAEIRLMIARILRLKGDPLQALEWASAARSANSGWSSAYIELGEIYCDIGQVKPALEQFDMASRLTTDVLPPLSAKARCLYDSGHIEEGIKAMEMVIEEFGSDRRLIDPYLLLSQWYADNGNREEAIHALRSSLNLWPAAPSLRSMLDKLER